jgi:predicted dehydrogenase
MKRVRVGLVGCGEVTQIMHLPSLRQLEDRFAVTALADVSRTVAEGVGERWDVAPPNRLRDWRDVVARDDVDAVLVSCPNAYHAEVAVGALEAGKHVLIEKPMCLTRREADEVVDAQQRTGLVVQVGYMRRYAAAFREACRLVSAMNEIRLARVRNILCLNEMIGDQAAIVVRADDLSADMLARVGEDQAALLREELGEGAEEEALHTYFFLLSLCTHDFSAMRDLIGLPQDVLYATRRNGRVSPFLTMAFDYGNFVCHYEAGFDELPRVEQDLQVYANDHVVKVAYGTAHVRNTPVRLSVTEAVGRVGTESRVVTPSWEDPFVSEWLAFHSSVIDGAPVRASAADARLDVELCRTVADIITRPRIPTNAR